MARQPMLRPDPPKQQGSGPPDPLDPEKDDRDAGLYLARLTSTLAAHGGGTSSADLALDLVLNEIVEQACLATTATGAAIALLRGEAMVCRATSGTTAPDLGVRLDMRSGLSGACVRTRQVQRCSDTETDSRVDSTASRTLEVRSVLVVPVLDGEDLIGVFEIFSPWVNAFSEREVQTLQALSRRIVHTLRRAAEPISPDPTAERSFASASLDEGAPPNSPAEIQATAPLERPPARDRWTTLLNAIMIALALLLGWMVGHVGWQHATGGATASAPRAAKPQTVRPTPPPSPTGNEASAPPSEKPPTAAARLPAVSKPRPKSTAETGLSPADLVVYEKGKVIFRMPPANPATDLAASPAAKGSDVAPVLLPPEVANTYLLQRVEPTYPEAARQRNLQGPVVLDAVVGKDGTVQELKVISGDTQLTRAATEAVRQWRFKPYQPNGTPVAFKTEITLNFTLP